AGYCATAPVLSLGKAGMSEIAHHVVNGIQIEHCVADRARDVVASIEKRARIHCLNIHGNLLSCLRGGIRCGTTAATAGTLGTSGCASRIRAESARGSRLAVVSI